MSENLPSGDSVTLIERALFRAERWSSEAAYREWIAEPFTEARSALSVLEVEVGRKVITTTQPASTTRGSASLPNPDPVESDRQSSESRGLESSGERQEPLVVDADELWQSVLEAMAGIVTDMRQRDKRYLRITLSAKDTGEPVSIHIALGARSEQLEDFTKEWPNG